METRFIVGVDIGQRRDHTAIAVLEENVQPGELDYITYERPRRKELRLRFLERMPLGMSYLDITKRVCTVADAPAVRGRCTVVADATGVGGPVIDLLRGAGWGFRLVPVTITGGDREGREDGYYRAPKRNLISGMQVMLEEGRLHVAGLMGGVDTLLRELEQMQVKVTATGNETYGVWREGEHDDLVLAVALACWWADKTGRRQMYGTPPLGL